MTLTWIECQGLHRRYMIRFGKPCCPVEYEIGVEPTGELTAVVTMYCLEVDKSYEQIDIKSLETWMQGKGYPIASSYWHWREVSNEQR